MPLLCVEALTVDLVPQIAALETQLYPDPLPAEYYYAAIENPNEHLMALRENGDVIAWIAMMIGDGAAAVDTVAVRPGRSGQGLGSVLLAYAICWADDHDIERMHSEILWTNPPGLSLYRKFHFVEWDIPPSSGAPGRTRFEAIIRSLRGPAEALVARAEELGLTARTPALRPREMQPRSLG